MEYHEQAEKY